MKHKRNLLLLLLFSFGLAIFGFILDLGERVQNVWTNIQDISLMAFLIFGFTCLIYLPIWLVYTLLERKKKQGSKI
jgi:uncharacterized membrane protein YbhN (UPF0104 family)